MTPTLVQLCLLLPGLLVGIFCLYFLIRLFDVAPLPVGLLLLVFVLGGTLAPLEVLALQSLYSGRHAPSLACCPGFSPLWHLASLVLVVGLLEEASMLVVVRFTVYDSRAFVDPLQGVLLAGTTSLGFAVAENARYLAGHPVSVLLERALITTPVHLCLSAVWGLALGLQRVRPGPTQAGLASLRGWGSVLQALGFAALLHGAFDAFLERNRFDLAGATIVVLAWLLVRHLRLCRSSGTHCRRP